MIDLVFRRSQSKGAARLVLLGLADVAADTGEITAYARSHTILAGKANCDDGTVRKAIGTLEDLGEIEVIERGDGRKSSSYLITLAEIEGVPDAPPAPARSTPRGGQKHPQGERDAPPISPSDPDLFHPDPSDATSSLPAVDPKEAVKATAHALAVRAFGREVKPVARGGFVAVLGLIRAQVEAGVPVDRIEAAIDAGVDVWTTAGLSTALAKLPKAGNTATGPRWKPTSNAPTGPDDESWAQLAGGE